MKQERIQQDKDWKQRKQENRNHNLALYDGKIKLDRPTALKQIDLKQKQGVLTK